MITTEQEYYQALVDKNSEYVGVFYEGVKTTGVFCHSICPARKPKFENCMFFESAEAALLAGYRPCKRCRPLSHPNQAPEMVQQLVDAVEANPEKKWHDKDLRDMFVDTSTARRQFKKRFGMTFVEYARARRMGLAMKQIKNGSSVIDAQLATGYESGSGFRDAFTRIIGAAPALAGNNHVLKAAWLDTPLGPMIAIADENDLLMLEFVDRQELERAVQRLREKTGSAIVPGCPAPIESIKSELEAYFVGKLNQFETPVAGLGTPFQQRVWEELQQIPFGETWSYTQVAQAIGKPSAVRAVASANGANPLAIIVPCHRVIRSSGHLGGYGGGLSRKKWLIQHETQGAAYE